MNAPCLLFHYIIRLIDKHACFALKLCCHISNYNNFNYDNNSQLQRMVIDVKYSCTCHVINDDDPDVCCLSPYYITGYLMKFEWKYVIDNYLVTPLVCISPPAVERQQDGGDLVWIAYQPGQNKQPWLFHADRRWSDPAISHRTWSRRSFGLWTVNEAAQQHAW